MGQSYLLMIVSVQGESYSDPYVHPIVSYRGTCPPTSAWTGSHILPWALPACHVLHHRIQTGCVEDAWPDDFYSSVQRCLSPRWSERQWLFCREQCRPPCPFSVLIVSKLNHRRHTNPYPLQASPKVIINEYWNKFWCFVIHIDKRRKCLWAVKLREALNSDITHLVQTRF